MMDWEPAESYYMDVDVTPGPFSFTDCDVYMAPPEVPEVHMASPILTSQPPPISEIILFLPPLEMKMKPIVFPPFNIHAVSRQALEPLTAPKKKSVPLDDSSFVYMPAVATYQVEPPTMASTNFQGDNYTFAVHNQNHFPPNSVYRPLTPPSKSRTTLRDVSPPFISVKSIDILDEEGQIADSCATTLSPLIESTSSAGWPGGIAGLGDIAPNVDCIPWPNSIGEQDVTPSTPHLVTEINTPEHFTPSTPHHVAETNNPEWVDEQDFTPSTPHLVVAESTTPEWIDGQDITPSTPQPIVAETTTLEWTVDEDVIPLSHYPIFETITPFHWPEISYLQGFVVDLIDLWSPNIESSNFNEDDSVLRAFGVSSLQDLEWILEGFRATSVADACIESKSASNSFEAMFAPAPLSPVSPYDWAVSDIGPDLISFDSAYGLQHNIQSGPFKLPSLESWNVIQFESNGLFQTSTPAPYNRSASPDVQSHSPFDPLVKATYARRNAPRGTKADASTQTEEFSGATYGTSFQMI
jgi:hypothetical protein